MPAGPFTLGATPSALKGTLPPILKKWIDKYGNIEVLIEPASSTVLYERVLRGELDAAILVHPLFEMPKTVNWKTLRTERLILLTRSRMARREPFAIIKQSPYIRYDRRVVAGKMADDYLKAHGVHPNACLELDGIDPALTRHGLPGRVPTRRLGLLWLRANVREKLVRAFLELASP